MSVLALLAQSAFAWSDVSVSVLPPAGAIVYETDTVVVNVPNTGNKSATAVVLTIDLPVTNTSPTSYVMGTLGAKDARCVTSGNDLVCTLGTINKGVTASVWFDIALPYSSAPISIKGTVTTTAKQNSVLNDSDTEVVPLGHPDLVIAGGETANIDHCTGTALTSFFECECFPTSISSHTHVFNADGSLTVPEEPLATGWWSQPTDGTLEFAYEMYGAEVAFFSGVAVDGACFEGVTTFPDSTWVSPYSVCI